MCSANYENVFFRWFKFTLKPPNSITHGKLRLAIWDTSFWTFCSNLDTRDLETYPRTYSGHFWNKSIFDDSRAVWVLFRKWVVSENQSFLNEGAIVHPFIGLVLGGEVPRLNHGPICFPISKHLRGCYGPSKVEYHFLTLSRRIKVHLLLMYCIKNQSIGVS